MKRTCRTTLTQIKAIHDGDPLLFFRRHSLCNCSEFLSLRTNGRVDYAKVIDPTSARVAYCVVLWGDCSLGGTGARNRGCSGVNRLLFGFLDFFLALRCVSKWVVSVSSTALYSTRALSDGTWVSVTCGRRSHPRDTSARIPFFSAC